MSEIKINENFEPKQGKSNLNVPKSVPTIKPKEFYVKPETSLEDNFFP
jgi:hypothetical protein